MLSRVERLSLYTKKIISDHLTHFVVVEYEDARLVVCKVKLNEL